MKFDLPKNGVVADIEELDWFKPDSIKFVSMALVGDGSMDLTVVAGDVLYKRVLLEPFFMTVRHILELKKNSNLLLCHIPRAGVEQSDVVSTAKSIGLQIEPVSEDLWKNEEVLKYCPEEDSSRAAVYNIILSCI